MAKFLVSALSMKDYLEWIIPNQLTEYHFKYFNKRIVCGTEDLEVEGAGSEWFILSHENVIRLISILANLDDQPILFQVDNDQKLWLMQCIIN